MTYEHAALPPFDRAARPRRQMTTDHKAENRFLLSLLVGLAVIMAFVLPVIGRRLIHEFRTLLIRQVLDDNRAIAETFVAFARSAWEEMGEDEGRWLQRLQSQIDQRALPGRRYIWLVNDFGRVCVAPSDLLSATPNMAGHLIEPYNREFRAFDTRNARSLQDLLVELRDRPGFPGRCPGPGPPGTQNLVYFVRFTAGDKPWLVGVHQIEGEMKADLEHLFHILVILGVCLVSIIVMASYLVMRRLVWRYERERERYVDQIKEHAREIQEVNEQLRQLQESKNRLYARLSHDLRAPLNSVVSACELLKMGTYGAATEQQITTMDRVIRNAEVLVRLIDQILQLTKLETGQWQIDVVPFRLETVIDDVVNNLRPLAEEKGIVLGARIEPGIPFLQSDQEKIYLILQNLVGNALKFTDRGEVEVRARRVENDQVEISVRDTGPGIGPEKRDQIFQEFVVMEGRERAQGVGLGLPITSELTRLVGGVIRVDSEVGEGSTFTVRFPARLET